MAAHLLSYLKKLKLRKFFSDCVTDPRRAAVTYSLPSIIQTALSNVLFRMGSKNAFHKEGRSSEEAEASIAKFCGIESGLLPTTRAIDDVLKRLNYEEINEVQMSLFDGLRKDKLFSNHSMLTPGGEYHIAIDAETIHKYTEDSAHDCKNCPFCLKRERGEEVWYLHTHLVISFVCPGRFKLPLYLYPIHAQSLKLEKGVSEEKFKQECELAALPIVIAKIRERFPRLNFCVLLDSLYANGPVIKLLNEYRMDFMIVRKKGCMKTVGQDCDGLEKIADDQIVGRLEETCIEKEKEYKRSYRFFNDINYQGMKLNVLRFEERVFDRAGIQLSRVCWEWLVSFRLKKKNAPLTAFRGRMRWLEEDLFNTLKNRGFSIRHDYSRQPHAQIIWVSLILLAFFITELFALTRQVTTNRRNRSLKDFMRSIFYELWHLYEEIFKIAALQKKTQFRYCFEKIYVP